MKVSLVAALGFAILWTYLAVARHQAFQTNAFDLGYASQTLWNTAHGQPYHFTTLEGVPFSPEGSLDPARLRKPQSLLAFHVEPLLVLIAPVFALWPDPRLLLGLQAIGLAVGALGAAALARARLKSDLGAASFGLGYLLSPALAAAALSDFHAVALGAGLLMGALACFATSHRRWAVALTILAASAREDAAIAVTAYSAYLWIRGGAPVSLPGRGPKTPTVPAQSPGRWSSRSLLQILRPVPSEPPDPLDTFGQAGLWLMIGGAVWVLLVFGAITPFFNGTISALLHGERGVGSIFWHRYEWLGASPFAAARNVVLDPGRWLRWFAQPDVRAYLVTLFLTAGGLAILAPGALVVTLPIVLENSLSSFDWMRSGGAHYSTILVPLLVGAGIEGTRWLAGWAGRRRARFLPIPLPIALVIVLICAAANHVWLAASPLVPGYAWPAPDASDRRVAAALETIPPTASVSASSAVYPHLSSRAAAYWFPAVNVADYVAVDLTRSTDPVTPREVKNRVTSLLRVGDYGIQVAQPGLLILRRGAPTGDVPPEVGAFARATAADLTGATRLSPSTFGDDLRLVAFRLDRYSTITVFGPAAVLTTYWQTSYRLPNQLSFAFYLTRRSDGAIVGELRDQAPEPIWYPTNHWQPGETVQIRLNLPRIDNARAIGVAVVGPNGQRLPISTSLTTAVWDNRTIVRVTRLDGG